MITIKDVIDLLLKYEGIKYFTASEVLFKGKTNAGINVNKDPKLRLVTNIIPTLKVLDLLREEIGEPIEILSGYRNIKYNRVVGGARNSQHLSFRAIDFKCKNKTPNELAEILLRYRDEGLFKGGIGVYKTFVHLDTRGENITW